MHSLSLLIVFKCIAISMATNGSKSFIDTYLSSSIRPFCEEIQEKLEFKYSFRGRTQKNINSHVVYLFTEDKVFQISQMTAALNTKENNSFVIPEIFFNEVLVKDTKAFWDGKHPNDTFNAVFSDPMVLNVSYWLFGDKYRPINVSDSQFKVTAVKEPIEFSKGEYGFMKNTNITAKGFQNIFSIDIAEAGAFLPIRVYVKDLENDGKSTSFAFYNKTEVNEEFEGGKKYDYSFNSAAFLVAGTSLASKTKQEWYNHYFELRTRKGKFSLFDFTYNRDFLLIGTTEELLGCPPSFCHSGQFDDIIRLHDGTKLLFFHEWVWNFMKPGERVVWEENFISDMSSRKHISRSKNFDNNPFKYGIRVLVDGSFIDESILYIFRNGSFISSKDDKIVHNSTSFEDYKPIDKSFKGVPSHTYDAILYHKESKTVFFIKEDKYWGYSMASKSLISEDFPKHIENLGLPYDFRVKSTYVEEDNSGKQIEFYLFTENRYIVFKENEFKNGRFLARKHTYYCTSVNFFGCSDQQFVCPELPTTTTPESGPKDEQMSDKGSNLWLYIIILIVIIVVLIAIIGIVVVLNSSKKSEKADTTKNVKKGSVAAPKPGGAGVGPIPSNVAENTRSKI